MIFMVSLVLGMRTTVNDYLEDRSIKGLLSQEELLSQQQMGGLGMLYRLASAEGAKKTFFEHPVIGTGIGLSPWSIRYHMMQDPTPELRTNGEYLSAVDEDKGLMPNAKNMPLRLLAETGLLGFALYIFFILAHGPRLFSSRWEFIVLPLMVLAALVVDWMSLDSFALAAPWLALAWSRQITLDAELKEKIN